MRTIQTKVWETITIAEILIMIQMVLGAGQMKLVDGDTVHATSKNVIVICTKV
jgi:hypothetical protein